MVICDGSRRDLTESFHKVSQMLINKFLYKCLFVIKVITAILNSSELLLMKDEMVRVTVKDLNYMTMVLSQNLFWTSSDFKEISQYLSIVSRNVIL